MISRELVWSKNTVTKYCNAVLSVPAFAPGLSPAFLPLPFKFRLQDPFSTSLRRTTLTAHGDHLVHLRPRRTSYSRKSSKSHKPQATSRQALFIMFLRALSFALSALNVPFTDPVSCPLPIRGSLPTEVKGDKLCTFRPSFPHPRALGSGTSLCS
jgi:hypothetical protein